MFTSLNVVRMALVGCDCSRRSAMRARRRVIGTRCSGRSFSHWSADAGALTSGSDGFAAFGAAAGAACGLGGRCATRVSTSPLVMRPSGRCRRRRPSTGPSRPSAWRRPASHAVFAARGGCGLRSRCRGGGRRGSRSRLHFSVDSSGACGAFGVDLGDHLIGDDGVAVVLDDLREHAGRRAPALRARPCRSRSRSESRRCATASPGFFFHCSMVASDTDSDSWGTLTSTIAIMNILNTYRVTAR